MSKISDFSFALQNILPESGTQLTQILTAKKRGDDLGQQYAVHVKVINEQDVKIDLQDKKYFWIPLKVTDAAGHETWIKVDKSDLKNKFHITKKELDNVSNQKDFEILMKTHLRIETSLQHKAESKGIVKAYHNFIKSFICYFTVSPAVKKEVQLALANSQFEEIYTKKTTNILSEVKEHLNNNKAMRFFDDEMILQIIDETIIEETNKKLIQNNQPSLNEAKIHKLNEGRRAELFKKNTSIQRRKISKLDVSGLDSFGARFAKKTSRFFNLLKNASGFFNARMIVRGASQNWDAERLKAGKHQAMQNIGAEHITLKSKTGCKVDAHFLSAATFMEKLEKLGGKRGTFEFEVKNPALTQGKKCLCKLTDGSSIEMMEVTLTDEMLALRRSGHLLIGDDFNILLDKNIIIFRTTGNKFYVTDLANRQKIRNSKLVNDSSDLANVFVDDIKIEYLSDNIPLTENKRFAGIKFDKKSSNWQGAKKIVENMGIDKSSWSLVETKESIVLVPRQYAKKVKYALNENKASLSMQPSQLLAKNLERGVALLTMNQSNIYEQYPYEMLTFAFEGVDVMMYNNPGKGLSTGGADSENINASIEASYQYLKHQGIPDEKILAKGQCFGAAPTAWLGGKHPKINLMLDQNPANFYDIAVANIYAISEDLTAKDRNVFAKWAGKLLKDNFIINRIAKTLFSGYDLPGDLRNNKGHKIFNLDVPVDGFGGDGLVPEHHIDLMLNDLAETNESEVMISMNPGAKHVTDWWLHELSRDTTLSFLKRAGISQSFF